MVGKQSRLFTLCSRQSCQQFDAQLGNLRRPGPSGDPASPAKRQDGRQEQDPLALPQQQRPHPPPLCVHFRFGLFGRCVTLPSPLCATTDVVPLFQVLPTSYKPTTPVTFAASSRPCLKSWRPRLSRGIMTSKRKARARPLPFSQRWPRRVAGLLPLVRLTERSLSLLFCGVQQALFCAVQCWRTVSSVRRPFLHQRWQPRPGRVSSKVRLPTTPPLGAHFP